jgi:hypothetical protein
VSEKRASLVIDPRFRGPDDSGNGGYVCGLVAIPAGGDTGGAAITVTLRVPPPLATALEVASNDGHATLRQGDTVIAEAAAADLDMDPVEPVPAPLAEAAQGDYPGLDLHPFPHCFVCGTDREPGDGLGLRPGRLADGTGRTACTWSPDATLAGAAGRVGAEIVWAALDCPGGWSAEIEGRPMVLGRMTARVADVPAIGEACVVMGRLLGTEGRKTWTASTVYGADGRELGRAHSTWITITRTAPSGPVGPHRGP